MTLWEFREYIETRMSVGGYLIIVGIVVGIYCLAIWWGPTHKE